MDLEEKVRRIWRHHRPLEMSLLSRARISEQQCGTEIASTSFIVSHTRVSEQQRGMEVQISKREYDESVPTFPSSRQPHLIVYPVPAVAAATCGGRCGVLSTDCRGSGGTILCEL